MKDNYNSEVVEDIKKLEDLIAYENSMYETALTYPTDTPQFYHALELTRQKINSLYAQLDMLKEQLT
jgi:hypothetical protein